MSDSQMIFARVEKKFLLDPGQYESFAQILYLHGMKKINYPDPTTCSIYYDTDECILARRSIDKPTYKEKLRLRIYGHQADDSSTAFLEIKKKYKGIVFKRRVSMNYLEAEQAMQTGIMPSRTGQIGKEIAYFQHLYPGIYPKALIAYERETWQAPGGIDLRITFDSSIRFRADDLDLRHGCDGHLLMNPDMRMMELKLPMVFPQWMADSLWGLHIRQIHFSKYGEAYTRFLSAKTFTLPHSTKEIYHVA